MQKVIKPKHGSLEWLKLRHRDEQNKVVFGASDAPALMGDSPYKTRADLYINKLQEPEQSIETPEFRRGNILEPVLLQQASEFFSCPIFTPEYVYKDGRFAVSLDGVDNADNPNIIVEAKTTTRYAIETGDDLPKEWLWQGWCQQGVLSPNPSKPLPVWFIVLDKYQRFSCVEMPNSRTAFRRLNEQAERFGQAVELQQPIPDDLAEFTAEQVAQIFPPNGESLELNEAQISVVLAFEEARQRRQEAEEQEKTLRNAIAQILQSKEIGTYQGKKIVSWKQQKGRSGINITLLRNENPELCAHYETEGTPYRVLRTHKI